MAYYDPYNQDPYGGYDQDGYNQDDTDAPIPEPSADWVDVPRVNRLYARKIPKELIKDDFKHLKYENLYEIEAMVDSVELNDETLENLGTKEDLKEKIVTSLKILNLPPVELSRAKEDLKTMTNHPKSTVRSEGKTNTVLSQKTNTASSQTHMTKIENNPTSTVISGRSVARSEGKPHTVLSERAKTGKTVTTIAIHPSVASADTAFPLVADYLKVMFSHLAWVADESVKKDDTEGTEEDAKDDEVVDDADKEKYITKFASRDEQIEEEPTRPTAIEKDEKKVPSKRGKERKTTNLKEAKSENDTTKSNVKEKREEKKGNEPSKKTKERKTVTSSASQDDRPGNEQKKSTVKDKRDVKKGNTPAKKAKDRKGTINKQEDKKGNSRRAKESKRATVNEKQEESQDEESLKRGKGRSTTTNDKPEENAVAEPAKPGQIILKEGRSVLLLATGFVMIQKLQSYTVRVSVDHVVETEAEGEGEGEGEGEEGPHTEVEPLGAAVFRFGDMFTQAVLRQGATETSLSELLYTMDGAEVGTVSLTVGLVSVGQGVEAAMGNHPESYGKVTLIRDFPPEKVKAIWDPPVHPRLAVTLMNLEPPLGLHRESSEILRRGVESNSIPFEDENGPHYVHTKYSPRKCRWLELSKKKSIMTTKSSLSIVHVPSPALTKADGTSIHLPKGFSSIFKMDPELDLVLREIRHKCRQLWIDMENLETRSLYTDLQELLDKDKGDGWPEEVESRMSGVSEEKDRQSKTSSTRSDKRSNSLKMSVTQSHNTVNQ